MEASLSKTFVGIFTSSNGTLVKVASSDGTLSDVVLDGTLFFLTLDIIDVSAAKDAVTPVFFLFLRYRIKNTAPTAAANTAHIIRMMIPMLSPSFASSCDAGGAACCGAACC